MSKILDVVEQPLILTALFALGGLVGTLLYTPFYTLCAICVLLGFHRSGVIAHISTRSQILAYFGLALILSVGGYLLYGPLDKALDQLQTNFAKKVASFIPRTTPIATPPPTAPKETISAPPFLISPGPIIPGYFFVGPPLPPAVSGPISMESANIALYVEVVNEQSVPTIIQGYIADAKGPAGSWARLQRVDTLNWHVYWKTKDRTYVSLDRNDFLDRIVYHTSFKSGAEAKGWSLYKYAGNPQNARFRFTVYAADGKHTSTELTTKMPDATQGAELSWDPAIKLPSELVIDEH